MVVDVKPARLLDEPKVADVLAWTGRLCAGKGWAYEVWSGADPVLLRNIRFLGAGRRPGVVDEDVVVKVAEAARPGMTIEGVDVPGHPAGDLPLDLAAVAPGGYCEVDRFGLEQPDGRLAQRVVQGVADGADRAGDAGLEQLAV